MMDENFNDFRKSVDFNDFINGGIVAHRDATVFNEDVLRNYNNSLLDGSGCDQVDCSGAPELPQVPYTNNRDSSIPAGVSILHEVHSRRWRDPCWGGE